MIPPDLRADLERVNAVIFRRGLDVRVRRIPGGLTVAAVVLPFGVDVEAAAGLFAVAVVGAVDLLLDLERGAFSARRDAEQKVV